MSILCVEFLKFTLYKQVHINANCIFIMSINMQYCHVNMHLQECNKAVLTCNIKYFRSCCTKQLPVSYLCQHALYILHNHINKEWEPKSSTKCNEVPGFSNYVHVIYFRDSDLIRSFINTVF